ncbi:DUF6248 family natural product biosynthesis protein [Streptomyces sp. NPDC001606]
MTTWLRLIGASIMGILDPVPSSVTSPMTEAEGAWVRANAWTRGLRKIEDAYPQCAASSRRRGRRRSLVRATAAARPARASPLVRPGGGRVIRRGRPGRGSPRSTGPRPRRAAAGRGRGAGRRWRPRRG